jgi:hypothetical protein
MPSANGEPGRNRTCDPRIKSALLYQLSYGPPFFNLTQENIWGFREQTLLDSIAFLLVHGLLVPWFSQRSKRHQRV